MPFHCLAVLSRTASLKMLPTLEARADAEQPPEPGLVPTKEDRCQHPAVAVVKFFAVNDGLQDLCS